MEDTDGIFREKLKNRRTKHYTEKDWGKQKHRPKALERHTEACAYW